MKNFVLFFTLFISLSFSAQQNYEWLKLKSFKTAVLNDSLKENSGLDFFQRRLFTFNDSGNSSEIFEIDKTSGKIKNVFKTNIKNIDWEAITNDSAHIYIGDFGNNAGTRKDLKIYKALFDSILISPISNGFQEISFFYPEQKDFISKNLKTDFDAEAFIFLNGKLHLFTKEWVSKKTSHYTIDPNILENQPAKKVETFNMNYVVTDAAYFDKKLYLIGYTKNTEVYLSIFNEADYGIFFKEKPRKFYLGSALTLGQIEGIAANELGVYISGEQFITPLGKARQQLYFIPQDKLK